MILRRNSVNKVFDFSSWLYVFVDIKCLVNIAMTFVFNKYLWVVQRFLHVRLEVKSILDLYAL